MTNEVMLLDVGMVKDVRGYRSIIFAKPRGDLEAAASRPVFKSGAKEKGFAYTTLLIKGYVREEECSSPYAE